MPRWTFENNKFHVSDGDSRDYFELDISRQDSIMVTVGKHEVSSWSNWVKPYLFLLKTRELEALRDILCQKFGPPKTSFVCRVEDVYVVTGRGKVSTVDILSGSIPVIPNELGCTNLRTRKRVVLSGTEYGKLFDKDYHQYGKIGLFFKDIGTDLAPGDIITNVY